MKKSVHGVINENREKMVGLIKDGLRKLLEENKRLEYSHELDN